MTVACVCWVCLVLVSVIAVTPRAACFSPSTDVSRGGGHAHGASFLNRRSTRPVVSPYRLSSSSSPYPPTGGTGATPSSPQERPTPTMPSSLFQTLAESSLELLASALRVTDDDKDKNSPVPAGGSSSSSASSTQQTLASSKVKSMALYLPQENAQSGQLEFIPAVLYPPPGRERVFIASDATSEGRATTLPRTLTTLPGFSQAVSLLPGYPMVRSSSSSSMDATTTGSSSSSDIGIVEEVLCAVDGSGAAALSVPLLTGSQTTGVLLVYPSVPPPANNEQEPYGSSVWTTEDREQVARAAKTLSLALAMDVERRANAQRQQVFAQALSDSMHQVKNPLQALRTYGKLLQQQLADFDYENHRWDGSTAGSGGTRKLLELADHLMIQGDRLTARLQPVDAILDEYADSSSRDVFALLPSTPLQQPEPASPDSPQQPPWSIPLLPPPEQEQRPSSSSTNELLSYASVTQAMGASSSVLRDFDVEMTFVADVLAPILDSFSAIAQDQEIQFDVEQGDGDDLPGVMANAEALQEAVSNVIDNAIKYVKFPKVLPTVTTNPSPHVKVTVQPNPKDENIGVTILIEDNGPGIPDNSKDLVFQRGFRHDRTKAAGGSGIGLDIAKALVEKMGGSLDILSEKNRDNSMYDGARLQFKLYREVKQSL